MNAEISCVTGPEVWISRETGKECILEYIKGNHHWYSIPEFNRPQPCRSDVFLAAMHKHEKTA